jgi:preprotein translocase SecF subunit
MYRPCLTQPFSATYAQNRAIVTTQKTIRNHAMFNFVQRRKLYYLFSGLLILISFIAMGISMSRYPERSPVRLGIDFLGGSLYELQFVPSGDTAPTGQLTESMLTTAFNNFTVNDARIQRLGDASNISDQRWQVRSGLVNSESTEALKDALDAAAAPLGLKLNRDGLRTVEVSPTVGAEVTRAALIAVIVGGIVVTGFIMFAFRKVPNALRYGICAVLAMIHDIIILVGAMSIMGLLFGWEADSLFITAVLTVVAYSVQDSIVVFDRIRENSTRHRGEPYELIVNRSIMETVQRSITTQMLVVFVLLSLLLMGGTSIRPFVGVLLIGLISGTYSSLFVGIPLLVSWQRGELPILSRGAAQAAS